MHIIVSSVFIFLLFVLMLYILLSPTHAKNTNLKPVMVMPNLEHTEMLLISQQADYRIETVETYRIIKANLNEPSGKKAVMVFDQETEERLVTQLQDSSGKIEWTKNHLEK